MDHQEKHIDISENLNNLSERVVKLENEYSYSREEQIRQGNERIVERISKIIKLAENTIAKLIDLERKQTQFILS